VLRGGQTARSETGSELAELEFEFELEFELEFVRATRQSSASLRFTIRPAPVGRPAGQLLGRASCALRSRSRSSVPLHFGRQRRREIH